MQIKAITNTSKEGTLKPHWDGWLQERFPDHFAQIGTINTLKLRNAVKDVARAILGRVPPDIEQWCKGFIMPPQGVPDLQFIMGYHTPEGDVPGSIQTDRNLQDYIKAYPDHWDIVKESLALWRSNGRHAAGYVISNDPIDEFIPTTHVSDVKVVSFSGPECEAVGAIKMDFLVVNSVKDVQQTIKLIQERHLNGKPKDQTIDNILVPGLRIVPGKDGALYDIWDLPEEEAVFADLYSKTETVFQFDSNSARQWMKYFNGIIHTVNDMAIFTALDRPGPLDCLVTCGDAPSIKHNMLVEYARRARGMKGSPDIVKEFDSLCAETKGVMIYQESLMKVYQYFTDCTAAEAEEFRGDVGKKKKAKIEKAYTLFMERAKTKVTEQEAQAVWDSLISFAAYGFNFSHAVSYCKLAYACLWLKHHYPLEWWCGVLRGASKEEINDKFWKHCGDIVLLPDIKLSKATWEIEGDKIRAPISMLYGMGETAHKQLSAGAPYDTLESFCQSIVDHQKKNSITKEKEGKDGTITKVKSWGRSALDIGKIYSMLYAGCLDSIFGNLTVPECVDRYHEIMKQLYLKEGKKYVKSKKKLPSLDILERYQAKKDVLPPYGADLRLLLTQTELPEFLVLEGRSMRIKHKVWSREAKQEIDTFDPVVGGTRLDNLELGDGFVEQKIVCGIIAFIEDKKCFNYGPNKEKQAAKFFVEVEGRKREFVYWPDKEGNLASVAKNTEIGSIVALVIDKSSGRTDFNIRDIFLIKKPLESKEDKDAKDKGKDKEE